uniref:Uncharacterized protein n=1 Tax=Octopus bimaculoides TaxID=37653 RepID=A0A0L8FLZ4_OCTBM
MGERREYLSTRGKEEIDVQILHTCSYSTYMRLPFAIFIHPSTLHTCSYIIYTSSPTHQTGFQYVVAQMAKK